MSDFPPPPSPPVMPPVPGSYKSVTLALERVEELGTKYVEASEQSKRASRDETAALNAFNEASKQFDAMLAAYRSAAPNRTDFSNNRPVTGVSE